MTPMCLFQLCTAFGTEQLMLDNSAAALGTEGRCVLLGIAVSLAHRGACNHRLYGNGAVVDGLGLSCGFNGSGDGCRLSCKG